MTRAMVEVPLSVVQELVMALAAAESELERSEAHERRAAAALSRPAPKVRMAVLADLQRQLDIAQVDLADALAGYHRKTAGNSVL